MSVHATGQPAPLPAWYKHAENGYHAAKAAAASAQAVVQEVNKTIPLNAGFSVSTTSFLGAGYILFAVPNLIRSIYKAIVVTNAMQRIKHVAMSILTGGAIAESVAYCIAGLKVVGVVAKESYSWAAVMAKVLYPLQFLSLSVGVFYELRWTTVARSLVKKNITISKKQALPERVKNLQNAYNAVYANRELRKGLGISKRAGLDSKIETLRNRLSVEETKEQALIDGEKFVKELKTRVNRKFALEIVSTIVKIISIIVTGFLLFTPPGAALFSLSIAIGVVAVAILAAQKVMFRKEPFAQSKDVWYEKGITKLREGLNCAASAIEKSFKKTFAVLSAFPQRVLP